MHSLATWYDRHARLVLIGVLILLIGLAYAGRFIQDDAFISFRYAQHLAQGNGLVFNVGEPPVEGYTNFLWTVLMVLPHWLGIDPVGFSYAIGLGCFAGALLATYALARTFFPRRALVLLTVIVVGVNATFFRYATGGLETMLQALLLTASLALFMHMWTAKRWTPGSLAGLSVLLALAVLTHPDSALLGLLIGPIALYHSLRTATGRDRLARALALIGPAALIGGTWAAWKLAYYGDLLPNSLYAKVGVETPLNRGFFYLMLFLYVSLLLPVGLAGLPSLRRLDARRWTLLGFALLWMGYILRVGGDFMEFRFMVPVLPVLGVMAIGVLFEGIPWPPVRLALLLVLLAGPIFQSAVFPGTPRYFIETIDELEAHLTAPDQNWLGVGTTLGEVFAGQGDVTIATTAAGAIPYLSELRTVDMLGLNDRWIARHGVITSYKPGHQAYAPLSYLAEQSVDLVIGHPILESADVDALDNYRAAFLLENFYLGGDAGTVEAGARMVRIPIADGYALLALLLDPDPGVEATIARQGWSVVPAEEYRARWAAAEAGE